MLCRGVMDMIVLRKKVLLLFPVVLILLAALFRLVYPAGRAVFAPQLSTTPIVILDAGHGGMDGGAVSSDGIVERELNLEITKRLALLMIFCGEHVALTRIDSNDLSSPDAATVKDQKRSDLKNRVTAINAVPNATLISIHQNSLPGHPEVYGAQVFYNSVSGSNQLAVATQQQLNISHNAGKARIAKEIDNSIYLMSEVRCPAILVECGFLSSPREAHALCTPDYQKSLALAITAGYLSYTNEGTL